MDLEEAQPVKRFKYKRGVRVNCPKYVLELLLDKHMGPMWEICAYICLPIQNLKTNRKVLKELGKIRKLLEEIRDE